MVNWFGPAAWGAPICRDAPRCDVPVGEQCAHCARVFVDTDHGVTMPFIDVDHVGVVAYHLECFLSLITPKPWKTQ